MSGVESSLSSEELELERLRLEKEKMEVLAKIAGSNVGGYSDDSVESSLSDMVQSFLSSDELEKYTDVTLEECFLIAKLWVIHEEVGDPYTPIFMNKFLALRMSRDRKSRKEFTEVLKRIAMSFQEKVADLKERMKHA